MPTGLMRCSQGVTPLATPDCAGLICCWGCAVCCSTADWADALIELIVMQGITPLEFDHMREHYRLYRPMDPSPEKTLMASGERGRGSGEEAVVMHRCRWGRGAGQGCDRDKDYVEGLKCSPETTALERAVGIGNIGLHVKGNDAIGAVKPPALAQFRLPPASPPPASFPPSPPCRPGPPRLHQEDPMAAAEAPGQPGDGQPGRDRRREWGILAGRPVHVGGDKGAGESGDGGANGAPGRRLRAGGSWPGLVQSRWVAVCLLGGPAGLTTVGQQVGGVPAGWHENAQGS